MKSSKLALFVALGVVFWFNAAMIVRFAGTRVFTENNPNLIWMYLLAIPITALSIILTKFLSGFPYNALLKPVVIMTLVATILDGIALAWFGGLYGDSQEVRLYGAALILWAAGLGLLIAFILESRKLGNEHSDA
jgi:hypothetical protein